LLLFSDLGQDLPLIMRVKVGVEVGLLVDQELWHQRDVSSATYHMI